MKISSTKLRRLLGQSTLFAFVLAMMLSILLPTVSGRVQALAGSDFDASRIIDDSVFYNSSTMSSVDIQNFLNAKVPVCDTAGSQSYNGSQTRAQYSATKGYSAPFTCLKDYTQSTPSMNSEAGLCGGLSGGTKTAAQIINDVSIVCGINPQVLLVLLQKEQSLVTDTWPWPNQYVSATGFGCPDTAPCDASFAGFFYQVYNAARQFKRYARDASTYSYRVNRNNNILYNPSTSCGAGNVFIQTQATASLYNYTPYQPNQAALANLYGSGDSCSAYGNRNFWRQFIDWFGKTTGCLPGVTAMAYDLQYGKSKGKASIPYLVLASGTGTGCVEFHGMNGNFSNWVSHLATQQPAIDVKNSKFIAADIYGNGYPDYILIGESNTGSGKVEFHVWDPKIQQWVAHIPSNQPSIDTTNSLITFADVNGTGKAVPILVGFRGTGTGRVEFHIWNSDMTTWAYHTASNQASIDPANSSIEFADVNGTGKAVPILVGFRGTGTGRVEFHIWNSDMTTWAYHTASNQASIDPANSTITFADLDGNGREEAILEGLHNTSSHKLEFHVWNPDLYSWKSHTISLQDVLN